MICRTYPMPGSNEHANLTSLRNALTDPRAHHYAGVHIDACRLAITPEFSAILLDAHAELIAAQARLVRLGSDLAGVLPPVTTP